MSVHTDDYLVDPPAAFDSALRGLTLPAVFHAAASRDPEAVAIIDGDRRKTWRQWQAEVDALARGLQEAGVEAGDVVAVRLPNCAEFETLHIAIATIGALMMPIHLGNTGNDVLALLNRVDAAFVVLPADTQRALGPLHGRELLRAIPSLCAVLVAGEVAEEPGVLSLDRLLEEWLGSGPKRVDVRPDMPFVLLPSSGTTSARPKICLHSHDGLLSNTAAVVEEGVDAFTGTVIVACALTHLFGLQSMYSALFTSCGQAMLNKWDPDRFLELARQVDPSVVFAVPAQLYDIVSRIRESEQPAGFHPREVRTAGAALSSVLATEIRAALRANLVVVWGMSEIGYGTHTRADDPAEVAARSVGRPARGSRVRIVDEHGTVCPPAEIGELQYQGAGMFRGYFREPELTRAAVTTEGWLRTGDMASLADNGLVIFNGRAAELINVGGRKFNATEIQAVLEELPEIGPLAVVGKPDPRLGEYPCLIVTERANGATSLADVTDFLRDRGIADYKIPLELITVSELPRTPVGKIHRRALEKLLGTPDFSADDSLVDPLPSQRPALANMLSGLDDHEQNEILLRMIHHEVEAVLGEGAPRPTDATQSFTEIGINSVSAIELRNRLTAAAGVGLPATLVFDHPTPAAVVRLLRERLDRLIGKFGYGVAEIVADLENLLSAGATVDTATAARLKAIATRWAPARATVPHGVDINEATDEELFRMVDSGSGQAETVS